MKPRGGKSRAAHGRTPLLVVFGPTAVGKTQFLERLHTHLPNIEIINADALQVYRLLNIGTAKPSIEQRERIPHHLIDCLEPTRQFNAGLFVKRAEELIPQIRKRNKLPVLCGGTAYYLRSFINGLPGSPPGDPGVRRGLKQELQQRGLPALLDELARVDPLSRERIRDRDSYRVLRALEVYRCSGKPLSAFTNPTEPRSDYAFLLLGLRREREELYARIEQRVERMFREGLVGELRNLLAAGLGFEDPGMRGIGYREFFELLSGCDTLAGVKERIKRNSRRYAKRQLTFFKSIAGVTWFRPDQIEAVRESIRTFLENEAGA